MVFSKKYLSLDMLCRFALAAVFFTAGVPKLLDPEQFALSINAYGMLPEFLVFPAALFLSFSEVVIAIGLLFGRSCFLWASLFLLLAFIAVLVYAISLGLDIDCGCFGPEDPEALAFSGIRTALMRDILFVILTIIPLWLRRTTLKVALPLRDGELQTLK